MSSNLSHFFAAFFFSRFLFIPTIHKNSFRQNIIINILNSFSLLFVAVTSLPTLPLLTLGLGFLRHGKVYHPVFCVGVRKHDLRTPVTVLVSLDRIIPWQFAPQQCLPLFHPALGSLQYLCLQGQAPREWWSSSVYNLSGLT